VLPGGQSERSVYDAWMPSPPRTRAIPPTQPTAHYTYDELGNRAAVARANGTTTAYTYNRLNRLTDIAHQPGASLLLGLPYTLAPSGLRTAIDETGAIVRHVDDIALAAISAISAS
jgi:YD repeat-containing protein